MKHRSTVTTRALRNTLPDTFYSDVYDDYYFMCQEGFYSPKLAAELCTCKAKRRLNRATRALGFIYAKYRHLMIEHTFNPDLTLKQVARKSAKTAVHKILNED